MWKCVFDEDIPQEAIKRLHEITGKLDNMIFFDVNETFIIKAKALTGKALCLPVEYNDQTIIILIHEW